MLKYIQLTLRELLRGLGRYFWALCVLTVLFLCHVCLRAFEVGLAQTTSEVWAEALVFKVVWFLGALHGRRVARIGCQTE